MTTRRFIVPIAIITVAAFSGQAFARTWTEEQNGTTYSCESIVSMKCTTDSKGNIVDCQKVQKTKCRAIAGPGSGKPAALATGDAPPPPPQPTRYFGAFGNAATAFSFGG